MVPQHGNNSPPPGRDAPVRVAIVHLGPLARPVPVLNAAKLRRAA
jgi:hypothetical protein